MKRYALAIGAALLQTAILGSVTSPVRAEPTYSPFPKLQRELSDLTPDQAPMAGNPVEHFELLKIDHSKPLSDEEKTAAFGAAKRKTVAVAEIVTSASLSPSDLAADGFARVVALYPKLVEPGVLEVPATSEVDGQGKLLIQIDRAKADQTYVFDFAFQPHPGRTEAPGRFIVKSAGGLDLTDNVTVPADKLVTKHIGFYATASADGLLIVSIESPDDAFFFSKCDVFLAR